MNPMHLRIFHAAARAPVGADGGGGDDTRPAARQTFSAEYVRELREEAKALRLKLREAEGAADELTKAKAALDDADKAREKAVADALKSAKAEANARLLNAELKAAAAKAGLIDPSDIRLFDTSKVTVAEDGTVSIPEGFFDEAAKAKPYLFAPKSGAETGNTTNPQQPPKPSTGGKDALAMSDEEFAAELAAITGRR